MLSEILPKEVSEELARDKKILSIGIPLLALAVSLLAGYYFRLDRKRNRHKRKQ